VTGVLKEQVDVVVSGINHGANLGSDTLYSGTVGAAREGCLLGFPSVAFSLTSKNGSHFETAARFARPLVRWLLHRPLPDHCLLNVNVPNVPWEKLKGALVTRLGRRIYGRRLTRRKDPRGQDYFWMAGAVPRGVRDIGSDVGAVAGGKISITPLRLHAVVEEFMPTLSMEGFLKDL
jgi:5'-nucleotidase